MSNEKVVILMSTYNGEKYLEEQLESLFNQEDINTEIFIRDDGSSDRTIEILKKYETRLNWYKGKNLKSAKSFLNLIQNAPEAEYYAFCDQDDVWNKDKLKRAIELMNKKKKDEKPLLYCANYQLVNDKLENLPNQFHATTTTFRQALAASCCTGCTVVFNKKLCEYLRQYIPNNIVMHDDWAHKVCLAVGGIVIYDKSRVIKYRQHENNVDGGRRNFFDKVEGVLKRIKSGDCIRSKQINEIIVGYSKYMAEENISLANDIIKYKSGIKQKVKILFKDKIRTEYFNLNIGFFMAILFGYY